MMPKAPDSIPNTERKINYNILQILNSEFKFMGIKIYMEPKGHSKCLNVLACRHLLSSGTLEFT